MKIKLQKFNGSMVCSVEVKQGDKMTQADFDAVVSSLLALGWGVMK